MLLGEFERNPATAIPRKRIALESQFQHVTEIARVEHGNSGVHEAVFALVRKRGRFADVVVAGHHQNASVPGSSRVVGVLEHIAAAVHARALAVPEPEYAVITAAGKQVDLLRAPDGGGCQVFVESRLEVNGGLFQERFRAPELLIQSGKGRTPVSGNETRCIQTGPGIALALQQQQLDQDLQTGEIERFRPCVVSLLKSLDLSQSHGAAFS